ncbi:MAG: ATP-binding protein [Pseudomonadota bacterium]
MRRRLANKILFSIVALISLLTISFFAYHTSHISSALNEQQFEGGTVLVSMLAQSAGIGVQASDMKLIDEPLAVIMKDEGTIFAAVYEVKGEVIKKMSRRVVELPLTDETLSRFSTAQEPFMGRQISFATEDADDFYAPVLIPAEKGSAVEAPEESPEGKKAPPTKIGFARVVHTRARIQAAENDDLKVSAAIAVVVLLLAVSIALFLSRRILQPLAALKDGVKRIAAGNLDITLKVASKDEIGELAVAFNSMAMALRQSTVSKDYVDNIVGSMNEALIVIDRTKSVHTVNRAAEELLGYTQQELLGRPVDLLLADRKSGPLSEEGWRGLLAGGNIFDVEASFRAKGGETMPVNLSAASMVDLSGELRGVVAVVRDMRETISLVEKLQARAADLEDYQKALLSILDDNQKARAVAEAEKQKTTAAVFSMTDGLVMFSEGNSILLINPAARSMLNLGRDTEVDIGMLSKALGLNLGCLLKSEGDGELQERVSHEAMMLSKALGVNLESLLKSEEEGGLQERVSNEVMMLSKALGLNLENLPKSEGEGGLQERVSYEVMVGAVVKHAIRVETLPVAAKGGERIGSMLVMRDITRQRELDQAKHELIANVSHELRTPLAAISNVVSGALAGVTGVITDKLKTHLEMCRDDIRRLGGVIDNLLDIAALDTGRATPQRSLVDFIPLIEKTCESMKDLIAHKELEFSLTLPKEPVDVYCDPNMIGQVVSNLLGNAIRYTPRGGEVSLSVAKKPGRIEVSVSDTGVGISPDEQRSMFERFHQIGRTYGPGEKGLGLGLPIAKQLVELHGGTIGVTSVPGKGSRFYFYLPLSASPLEEEQSVS